MSAIELIQQFGFPVACVICLGWYVAKVQAETRVDSKDREDKLLSQLGEMSATNKMLLETNAVLAKDINSKLDRLMVNMNEK